MKRGKLLLDTVLKAIKEVKTLKRASKILGVHEKSLIRFVKGLKASGRIKKVGMIWEIPEVTYDGNPPKAVVEEVRGHGFLFKAKLSKKLLLSKRQEIVNKAKIPNKIINNHKRPYAVSFIFKGYRMRFTEQSILIWQPKELSWYGINALEARNKAIADFKEVIYSLQTMLGFPLPEKLSIASNHYALIKNELAKQYNKSKEKLYVEDHSGLWLIIDNSWNLDELETVHPKTALENNIIVQQDFNELKETHLTRKKLKAYSDQNAEAIKVLTQTLTKFIEVSTPQTMDEFSKTNSPFKKDKDLNDYIG